MITQTPTEISLSCHPQTPCPGDAALKAAIGWEADGRLKIVYRLSTAVDRLRIPPRRKVQSLHGLWQHTCFELFLGAKNDTEYYEFNFSPSGEWAAYEFRNYRDGGPLGGDDIEPEIVVGERIEPLELSAALRWDRLQGITSKIALAVGLCAVVEALDGSLSYWALKHPPGKPDFHHADCFALELIVPG
ncbi:MAG TPA: DOMON-like domain-containing protein [Candidatus Limnocylindria bacterium]|nr:DOMON-like domain-containing protein [Candidatus Limnocylindria bacterium]